MIPLRDTVRNRNFPILNWIIIAACTLVFLFENSLSPAMLARIVHGYGFIPASLHLAQPAVLLKNLFPLTGLVTSLFLHTGWFHFLSNIWVLHIFGDGVEDRMGPGKYLLFYLAGGVVANLMHALVAPLSQTPTIGASGAIAAVMGAYFLSYPTARVTALVPIFIIPWFVEVPAVFFLGFWFLSQLYSGLFSLGVPTGTQLGGVAWWAHIGGFVFGLAFARWFARQPRLDENPPDPCPPPEDLGDR